MRPLNRMSLLRRHTLRVVAGLGLGVGLALAAGLARPIAQEQAPERHDLTITAKDFRFSPSRIEVGRDDLVRLTVKSEDVAYGFTIDEYRLPAPASTRGTRRSGCRQAAASSSSCAQTAKAASRSTRT